MAENSSQMVLLDENTTASTQTQIMKSLAVQRLKNNELEEQCIPHFNLIKYLGPSPYDNINIMDHFGKLSTNTSMAALAEACRLVDTKQKRRTVGQCLIVYSIQGKLSCN